MDLANWAQESEGLWRVPGSFSTPRSRTSSLPKGSASVKTCFREPASFQTRMEWHPVNTLMVAGIAVQAHKSHDHEEHTQSLCRANVVTNSQRHQRKRPGLNGLQQELAATAGAKSVASMGRLDNPYSPRPGGEDGPCNPEEPCSTRHRTEGC